MATKLLRMPAVIEMTGLGRSTIYRMMTEGNFPPAIKLGERAIAWKQSEIEAWIEGREAA